MKLAFDMFESKYQRKTAPNLIELEKKFVNIKLSSGKHDPDPFITDRKALCVRMKEIKLTGESSKTKTDLIFHVLANIPKSYDTQITEIESLLGTHPDAVAIEMLRNKLNVQYGRFSKNRDVDAMINHKKAL